MQAFAPAATIGEKAWSGVEFAVNADDGGFNFIFGGGGNGGAHCLPMGFGGYAGGFAHQRNFIVVLDNSHFINQRAGVADGGENFLPLPNPRVRSRLAAISGRIRASN